MPIPHPAGDYAITTLYSVPDDAWYLELDRVDTGHTLVIAIVPDEDPDREPTISLTPGDDHYDIPYDVMRWFIDHVDREIETSRAWMRLRPELVAVIRELREEHLGTIDDEHFPAVLAELRARVPEPDLPAVLAEAFGRRPDGSSCA
ncbi:hypothetical protein ACGFMM_06190 [Streptomyces sp. NPDC048604]|uniref:hypothetical protein n=1 Tax=Streptomyces sp. NPDC048604 TaxID=3365578 RepID=UPI0037109E5B